MALLLASTASACQSKPEVDPAELAAKLERDLDKARVRLRDGKVDDAKALYQNVIDNQPDNVEALYGLGRVAYEKSDNDKAQKLLEKAIAGKADVADYHAALGAVLVSKKAHAEAASAYGKAFELDKLEKEVEANRRIYESFLERFKQADVAGDSQTTNVRIIDPAQPPASPYKPNKQRMVLVAVAAG